jgi:hypothetical protein
MNVAFVTKITAEVTVCIQWFTPGVFPQAMIGENK